MAKTRINSYSKRTIARAVAKSVREKHLDVEAIKEHTHRLLQAGYQHFFDTQAKHEAFQMLANAGLADFMKSTDTDAMISMGGSFYKFREDSGSEAFGNVLGSKPFDLSWRDAQLAYMNVPLEGDIKYPCNLPAMMVVSEDCEPFIQTYHQELKKIIQAASQHTETLRSLGIAITKAVTAEALIEAIPEIEELVKASLAITEPMSLPAVANTAQISSLLAGLKPIEVEGAAA